MNKTRAASPITSWRFERAARFGAGWPVLGRPGLAGPDFFGGVFMEEVKHDAIDMACKNIDGVG